MREKRSKLRIKEEARLDTIVMLAEEQIMAAGANGINFNALIETSGISRGTFYALIPNKESLIAHMCIKGLNELNRLYENAKNFDGSYREKMLAVMEANSLFKRISPVLHKAVISTLSDSLKHLSIGQSVLEIIDDRVEELISKIVQIVDEAVFHGELVVPNRFSTFDFSLYLWSSDMGVTCIAEGTSNERFKAAGLKYKFFQYNILDAIGWHPLTKEKDHEAIDDKIGKFMSKNYMYPKRLPED